MPVSGSSDNSQLAPLDKFVGLENFKILAVNPTLQQLEALGFNFKKEPEYTGTDDDGNRQIRIDFVLNNDPEEGEPEISGIASFYVVEKNRISSTGKTNVCNYHGQFTWLEDINAIPDNMQWFKPEGIRAAYQGEEFLVGMLRNFCNVGKDGEMYIAETEALFSGNVSEIEEIVNSTPDNKVRMLCTVKRTPKLDDEGNEVGETFYQAFYTRKTERPYSTATHFLRL
jgi:hypothetical protein